jgi:ABC-type polysaccharide/polyol phosphate export permease
MSVSPGSEPALPAAIDPSLREAVLNDSAKPSGLVSEMVVLFGYRTLLGHLIARDIKVRYKRSLLGFFWTMLNPLLTMIILNFVFSAAFSSHIAHYGVYVLAGVLFWNFFAQSTTQAMNALACHQGLVKIVYMPRSIYAFAVVGSGLVHLGLAFVPLIAVMLWGGHPIVPATAFTLVGVLAIGLFTLGLALTLSTLAVFFSDVVQMFQILLVAWFYMTPIMFPKSIVPEKYRAWIELNPLTPLLDLFRYPIYDGRVPPTWLLLKGGLIAVVVFVVGWSIFVRNTDRLVTSL